MQEWLQKLVCLRKKFEKTVGHNVVLYNYGLNNIKNGKVAVVAGGGNSVDILSDIAKEGVNTFVTGITLKNKHSEDAHKYAEKHKINLIGGTHYSTEAFACIAMCNYFKKLELSAEFIEDKPVIEDM